jgi:hypothetical protein
MNNLDQIIEAELNSELPGGFKKQKNELLSKLQKEPTEEAVKQYSDRMRINLESAKERLRDNYRREVEEVEFKEVALRLSNGMKQLAPKMMGLELREQGREAVAKEALRKAQSASGKVDQVVTECRSMIENAKSEVIQDSIVEVGKKFDLIHVLNSLSSMAFEIESLRHKLEQMEQNTVLNRIKRFLKIK